MKSKIIDFSNLKGDFIGGLVAGVVALPLALALVCNQEATAGLYGAIMVIFAAYLVEHPLRLVALLDQ
jgi:SulP family sulfate permease